MSAFPLKMLYNFSDEQQEPVQAGVTVSSRHFKKAVQRNRVKRLLREAYRLQKVSLKTTLLSNKKSLILFFIYTSKTLPAYSDVYEKMGVLLNRLTAALLKEQTTREESL